MGVIGVGRTNDRSNVTVRDHVGETVGAKEQLRAGRQPDFPDVWIESCLPDEAAEALGELVAAHPVVFTDLGELALMLHINAAIADIENQRMVLIQDGTCYRRAQPHP